MGVIQVVSNNRGAGKTCLIGALLVRLRQQGRRAGYYRPFSATPQDDPDVSFVSQQLLAGSDAPPVPAPQAAPASIAPEVAGSGQPAQGVRDAISSLNATDVVLVEGPDLAPDNGTGTTLAGQVADLLDSKVLLMVQYGRGMTADEFSRLAESFGDRASGLVINSFPPKRRREVQQELVNTLRGRGLPILGAIPDDRFMLAVTVQQVADHLGGRWVQAPVNTDAYVDRFLIGGNIMDSGALYFGRYQNQAVITRSERPDIQMASLMCATRCLVLTGGAEPTEYVQVEASNREVPLILVDRDTISTAESLAGLLEQANARSLQKIQRFRELMEGHLDLAALDELLDQ